MYHVYKNGYGIAQVERLEWVRLQPNGVFIHCPEPEGQGVVLDGEIYHADGRTPIDKPTVSIVWKEDIPDMLAVSSIAFVTLAENELIDDVTATENISQFSPWAYPVIYKTGNVRQFGSGLYRCVQDHTSQADWAPDITPALWTKIGDPAEEWPQWSQPLGAHDVYAKDDKVSHGGKHWISEVDGNVWEPGVYGWREATP